MSTTIMDGNILTPNNWLVSNGLCFEVPVYQRLFTWTKSQFERLLDDLEQAKNKLYYLGIITIVKKNGTSLLIDGQQRLTTIAILASLLNVTTDDAIVSDITERLRYSARPDDTQALKNIWENGKSWMAKSERSCVERILERTVINPNMRELVLTVWQRLHDGANINVNVLTLLVSELPKAYEEDLNLQNEYFEKMNSSGKQLEPHEVLKVRICTCENNFQQWNAIEDFGKAYRQIPGDTGNYSSMSFFDAINTERKKSGMSPDNTERKKSGMSPDKWRSAPIDFPMFLRHVYALDDPNRELDTKTPLLKLFKDVSPTSCILTTMETYRQFLDAWVIHSVGEESAAGNEAHGDESKFNYWEKNGKETVYAVGLADSEDDQRMLKQLQMTLFALGDERQEWILSAYKEEKKAREKGEKSISVKWFAQYLVQGLFDVKQLTGETWDDNYLLYSNHPRKQLACLDFFLWALCSNKDEKNKNLKNDIFANLSESEKRSIEVYVPKAHRSVEHFHPQKDDNSSNILIWNKKNAVTGIIPKDLFGNLALISAGTNSRYSNLGVAGKSERIERLVEKGAIESIKLLLMRAECKEGSGNFMDMDKIWTPERARNHATKMLRVIRWGLETFAPCSPISPV